MKINFLVVLATFIATSVNAQKMTYDAGTTTFGIRAGVNFQNINGKDANGNKLNYDLKTGINAGVNAEIPVGTGSYLQPGVLFSQKGTKFSNTNELRLNYIEVPINFIYKPVLGSGRMLLGFGPYVGFGLGGKYKYESGPIQNELKVEFEKEASTYNANVYKGIDGGANFLAGYEFANNLSFQINAQLGLTNVNPTIINSSNDQTKMKNTGFGISAGYRF
jgi:hypothetical protein